MTDKITERLEQIEGTMNAVRQGWVSGYTSKELAELRLEHDRLKGEVKIRAQLGAIGGGYEFTVGELRDAFEKVADRENWKMPVKAFASLRTDRERKRMREAVMFMTGSVPTITRTRGTIHKVVADGYYAAIGA